MEQKRASEAATHLKLPKMSGSFHPDTSWSVGFLWALGSMPESQPWTPPVTQTTPTRHLL